VLNLNKKFFFALVFFLLFLLFSLFFLVILIHKLSVDSYVDAEKKTQQEKAKSALCPLGVGSSF